MVLTLLIFIRLLKFHTKIFLQSAEINNGVFAKNSCVTGSPEQQHNTKPVSIVSCLNPGYQFAKHISIDTGMKLSIIIFCILIFYYGAAAQNNEVQRKDELSIGLKTVYGKIIYGSNRLLITDPGSVHLEPGVRYSYPVKIPGNKTEKKYAALSGTAGFLFCTIKDIDSLNYNPGNLTYFTLSAGLYNMSTLSIGTEVFFWKGLGKRDLFGAKFLSVGYNGKNLRLYVSGLVYTQVLNTRLSSTAFSVDFFWKLIKG